MIASLLLVGSLLAADPSAEQAVLLKTFREEFVAITPGEGKFPASFAMGRAAGGAATERPVRTVTMQRPFQIARYEVPQNLWQAVTGGNPSRWKGPRNSVEMLSFAEAVAFCQKATSLMRAARLIDASEEIRLPSEAEWEYAVRAGAASVYSFGDSADSLGDYAWFTGNAAGNDPAVGVKKPNAWGLYDVHGYLWEWCADDWRDDYEGAPTDGSPRTEKESTRRVLRGGSWKDAAERLTSSFRVGAPAELRDDAVGLRCVLAKVVSRNGDPKASSR